MSSKNYKHQWEKTANRKRLLLGILISVTTLLASGYMAIVLPHGGATGLEIAIVVFFALLFAWISIGFWTSCMGFYTLVRDRKRLYPMKDFNLHKGSLRGLPQTAVLVPIYNEDVEKVFNKIAATYKSVQATGHSAAFDFFVLSDTTDPDIWVEEEIAWQETCRQAGTQLFYRHRTPNIKRKSGNIADFCRRWGRKYRYMIVLDADSVMAGITLVNLVLAMEGDNSIGILQTAPVPVGKNSLLARVQQFSANMYGPMFAAGLYFWQLGDAQYWGHNAIIRVEPFMKHCALPRLSGAPPMGGDILSHDFVEAALMRRAGLGVWLAYDMDGSYEEPPPTLIDELMRDRRWCQGNLQHLRLLFAKGLLPAHRYLFLNGAMAYISALLWLTFLTLSTIEALVIVLFEPDYFPKEGSLFPDWQVWQPEWMIILLVSTIIILFIPKVLSLILTVIINRKGSDFGGIFKATASVICEVLVSMLLAPLRMLAHSKFVILTLLGGKIGWTPPPRSEKGTSWSVALRFHGGGMALAFIWGLVVFFINRPFFWWLVPILVPLSLSAPISVWTSRPAIGSFFRSMGLFLSPDELQPPTELQDVYRKSPGNAPAGHKGVRPPLNGFVRAVVDPSVNCLHRSFRPGKRKLSSQITERLDQLVEKALRTGPESLTQTDKKQLLTHNASLERLHHLIWELPDGEMAQKWGII